MNTSITRKLATFACATTAILTTSIADAAPKVIVISLDGATPRFAEKYFAEGALPSSSGLGLIRAKGVRALRNETVSPSLTAPGHIAIATGSTAARNDVVANSFHLLASPFTFNISGFAAPIGGYLIDGPTQSPSVTAVPLWAELRARGMKVAAATFPGADGINATAPGLTPSPVLQPSSERTVDFTVPFGAFAGQGARGFSLTSAEFSAAPQTTLDQLAAAGRTSFSPVLEKTTPLESFNVTGAAFSLRVAALDTSNDSTTNYDTLVFFNATQGIQPGPFTLPSTGPAYVKASERRSVPFYLEGSAARAGVGFYVSHLAPDLSSVRIARYSANSIPRFSPDPAVIENVDDINANVGFWAPQPDFRIPERLSPGFDPFPDEELEAIYQDLVVTFVDYQTRVALRAIERLPDADLVMLYIEQPDGSGHQFLLTDPRQPTNIKDPASIGAGQDAAKIARYQEYLKTAYQVSSQAVQRIVDSVGTDSKGEPLSNILVVSDHGFEPFHTAVSMNAILTASGIPATKVRAVTSGPAVNLYISLQGREPNGTVTRGEYIQLQQQIIAALQAAADTNPTYTLGAASTPLFSKIYPRPLPAEINDPQFGRGTSEFVGQDSGDVYAILTPGYNFDGTQAPVVPRLGDTAAVTQQLSLPNFYGAHGYDPELPNMSAIFYAAGPDIRRGKLPQAHNIDIAPTVMRLLGAKPAATVQGKRLPITNVRGLLTRIAVKLKTLATSSGSHALQKAAQDAEQSLRFSYWIGEAQLGKQGDRVFNELREAVRRLVHVPNPPPGTSEITTELVDAAAELAEVAILSAKERGHTWEGLDRLVATGDALVKRGWLEPAVFTYRLAWKAAQAAR